MPENGSGNPAAQAAQNANDPRSRARRLYDVARAIEARATDAVCQELAREVGLLALDMLVEARIEARAGR